MSGGKNTGVGGVPVRVGVGNVVGRNLYRPVEVRL